MEKKKANRKLDKTLLILAAMVATAVAATFWKGGWELTLLGFGQAGQLFQTVWLRLILGFTLGGLVQGLVPSAVIAKWMGHTSGFKGILIGSYIGVISPGAPYITLPIIAAIYRAGAGVGPVIALLTGQSLLGLQMLLVWQIPFLGVEVPLSRYIAGLFLPPLLGLAGRSVYNVITRLSKTADESDFVAGHTGQQRDGIENSNVVSEKEEK